MKERSRAKTVQFINAKKSNFLGVQLFHQAFNKTESPDTKHDISRDHRQPLKSKKQMQKTKIENEHKDIIKLLQMLPEKYGVKWQDWR